MVCDGLTGTDCTYPATVTMENSEGQRLDVCKKHVEFYKSTGWMVINGD